MLNAKKLSIRRIILDLILRLIQIQENKIMKNIIFKL